MRRMTAAANTKAAIDDYWRAAEGGRTAQWATRYPHRFKLVNLLRERGLLGMRG